MLGKVPTSHFGHASITVAGMNVKTTEDSPAPHTQHISFWPGDGGAGFHNAFRDLPGDFGASNANDRVAEMNKLTSIRLEVAYCRAHAISYPPEWDEALREVNKAPLPAPRTGQKQMFDPDTNRAQTDPDYTYKLKSGKTVLVPAYSQSPQVKFYLPGLRAKGMSWGLNTNRMADWWINFRKTSPPYRAWSPENNCVGIAFQALREGGADAIVKLPPVRMYGEPTQVESYARELEQRLSYLEGATRILDVNIRSNHLAQTPVPVHQLSDSLWTFDAWKQASALGLMYQRSGAIREIDENLATFHKYTWKYAFPERYDAFMKLFLSVLKHREEKSDSKRSEAVAQLGNQILAVLKSSKFYDGR
jgi:hypothetical protein